VGKNQLPRHLQEQLDRLPNWTAKEVRQIVKRLTPEQRHLIDCEIEKASVKIRRALFRLILGGREKRDTTR
jgi:hypothetical protein